MACWYIYCDYIKVINWWDQYLYNVKSSYKKRGYHSVCSCLFLLSFRSVWKCTWCTLTSCTMTSCRSCRSCTMTSCRSCTFLVKFIPKHLIFCFYFKTTFPYLHSSVCCFCIWKLLILYANFAFCHFTYFLYCFILWGFPGFIFYHLFFMYLCVVHNFKTIFKSQIIIFLNFTLLCSMENNLLPMVGKTYCIPRKF